MEHLDVERLCDAFSRRSGVGTRTDALHLLRCAAIELAADVPDGDGRAVRLALGGSDAVHGLDGDFFQRFAARAGLGVGAALEHGEAFLGALAEVLPAEACLRMRKHLPPGLARFLAVSDVPPPPPHSSRREPEPPPPRSTLATGRPGSEHPICEANPDRAHTHSVAREGNPHGDSKLSSARGSTQERLHESLAEGVPPAPRRTLGGG